MNDYFFSLEMLLAKATYTTAEDIIWFLNVDFENENNQ